MIVIIEIGSACDTEAENYRTISRRGRSSVKARTSSSVLSIKTGFDWFCTKEVKHSNASGDKYCHKMNESITGKS